MARMYLLVLFSLLVAVAAKPAPQLFGGLFGGQPQNNNQQGDIFFFRSFIVLLNPSLMSVDADVQVDCSAVS